MTEQADSIDMVIRAWLAQGQRHGVTMEAGGDFVFLRRSADPSTAAAVWAPSSAYPLGLPDNDLEDIDHEEGTLADLRAVLGLPAWVASPAPTQEEPPTYLCHEIHVEPISGSFTVERARFSGFSVPPWSDDSEVGRVEVEREAYDGFKVPAGQINIEADIDCLCGRRSKVIFSLPPGGVPSDEVSVQVERLDTEPFLRPHNPPFEDVAAWRADPAGPRHPDQATPEEFARAVDRLGGAGSWTAVAALRLLERAEAAEIALTHSMGNAASFAGSCRLLRERAEKAEAQRDRALADLSVRGEIGGTERIKALTAEVEALERRLADNEGALTIRLNPNAAESIPGTDWQVDSPGQHSSHPNAQAAWIEAGIVLGVLDDGEGVEGLTRELLTRVEQIEALLVKRAQELEEVRKQLRQTGRVEEALRDALTSCDEARLALFAQLRAIKRAGQIRAEMKPLRALLKEARKKAEACEASVADWEKDYRSARAVLGIVDAARQGGER